jgi:hypothetical protein
MSPEDRAQINSKADARWRDTRIAEVKALMEIHNISVSDILESMGDTTITQTPHQPSGNTVAGS